MPDRETAMAVVGDVVPAVPPVLAAPSLIRVILQVLLIVAGIAIGAWALLKLASVLLVLVAAAVFAYVIAPLVHLAGHPIRIAGRRRHLPRGLAIALVYAAIAGSVTVGAVLLLPAATEQVNDMMSRAPAYAQSTMAWEHGWSSYYERLRMPLELRQSLDRSVLAAGDAAVESVRESAVTFVHTFSDLPWIMLVPILGFFLLKDATMVRRAIVMALPHRTRLRAHLLLEDVNATLARYVRGQLLACLLVGGLCGIGFAVIGVPYPVPLGVLAGALEFIPLVGPLLLAVLASIAAALHAPVLLLRTAGFLAIVRVAEDYVIYPRLIGRGIDLGPLAVILAVLTGAELAGVAGMFLAVPAMAIASVVYRHWLTWRAADNADESSPVQASAV